METSTLIAYFDTFCSTGQAFCCLVRASCPIRIISALLRVSFSNPLMIWPNKAAAITCRSIFGTPGMVLFSSPGASMSPGLATHDWTAPLDCSPYARICVSASPWSSLLVLLERWCGKGNARKRRQERAVPAQAR